MDCCFLRVLNILGDSGYYAKKIPAEMQLIRQLEKTGFVSLKKGTKRVFVLTEKGKKTVNGKKEINTEEFKESLLKAFKKHSTPMLPMVRIPEVRSSVVNTVTMPVSLFNKKLLQLHDEGIITLQTAMDGVAAEAEGGIRTENGVYFYITV